MSPPIVLYKEYYFISAVNDWNFHNNSGYKRYSISVTSAKILGQNVSSYSKWNSHIDSVIEKAKRRPYSLSQRKRSGLGTRELVQFFCTCIRPITEYASPVFHDSLPAYLSNELEGVQKRAMRIIFPFCSYKESLVESNLIELSDRR